MQDGSKSLHGFLHGIEWIMFHGHLDYFLKPPHEGRPNTKPRDHGTPNTHNRWFILFYHVWGPAWIEIHQNSIWLRARAHTTSHYTWGPVTTLLHDYGRCVMTAFGHFLLGSHNFTVTTLGSCVKWTHGCELSVCHGLPVLCSAYLHEVVFEISPSDHETWSIRCHVGTHADISFHLAFTYSVGSSIVVWSNELGPAPPFPPMRVLEV
jgi:hypothetical protein